VPKISSKHLLSVVSTIPRFTGIPGEPFSVSLDA
jgi:hypothetical protein